jgi:hypothetical protein
MRIFIFTGLATLALSGAAFAQTSTGADPVAQCRAVHGATPSAHIACLEAALTQQLATATEVEAPDARRFPFSRAEPEDEPAITVRIVRVAYDSEGLGRFVTEDGQVWRETTAVPRRRHLDPGETYTAVIDRGLIGGFRMNVEGIRFEYKVEPLN